MLLLPGASPAGVGRSRPDRRLLLFRDTVSRLGVEITLGVGVLSETGAIPYNWHATNEQPAGAEGDCGSECAQCGASHSFFSLNTLKHTPPYI